MGKLGCLSVCLSMSKLECQLPTKRSLLSFNNHAEITVQARGFPGVKRRKL